MLVLVVLVLVLVVVVLVLVLLGKVMVKDFSLELDGAVALSGCEDGCWTRSWTRSTVSECSERMSE